MLKVLLVEDETLVKVGINSLVNWRDMGFKVVAEGSNGEHGLSLIKEYQPDLVITDIVMPKMNGIDMMRKAKEYNPDITFIILSSYNEFDLVKQAMKYGAWDYILKLNISEESMKEMLINVKEKIISSNKKINDETMPIVYDTQSTSIMRQEFLKSILENNFDDRKYIDAKLPSMKLELNEAMMKVGLVNTNLYLSESKYNDKDLKLLDFMIIEILNEIGNEFFNCYFLKLSFGAYVMVFSPEVPAKAQETNGQIKIMGNTMLEMLKKYVNIDAAISISDTYDSYLSLPQALAQAKEAMDILFYKGYGSIIFFDDVSEKNSSYGGSKQINLKESLPKAIEICDLTLINNIFDSIVYNIQSANMSKHEIYELCNQTFCLCDIHLGEEWQIDSKAQIEDKPAVETVYKLQTLREILEFIKNYRNRMNNFLGRKHDDEKHNLVWGAKKYIINNCMGTPKLKEVADSLNISAGYLSSIFTKYTGMCFTDYVNKVKIDEAKKMLKDGQRKIYEISYLLGYENACYFSKIFKKITGCSPTEFVKNTVSDNLYN
ncbi:response regulator transcription factor [Ruminiclostridium cellobioparum]|jgi:two-component system response regulator YesN|uniref:response regulator transcription factor n=1 Tax=Ruminiclostridium cellobioparum TaxID=29355 RepID=UPI0028ADD4A5|nr:response regulator [Ruminiclostridium cellobioparum]